MEPFTIVSGPAAGLPGANIDTDVIMPKQFLKGIDRAGLGAATFHDLRYAGPGRPRPDFVLNRPEWQGACILVVGPNFGCGSSREHAVWGLLQGGIRAVVGTSFAGIFADNAANNGLLLIELAPGPVAELAARAADPARNRMTIDLPAQTIATADGAVLGFDCLLVAGVAAQFVLHLGFRTEDREHFVRAALLHDVGKAQIPLEILNKPGRLDADELVIMRRHPVIGYDILRESGCDAATLGAVRHHHEMLDGSGYPDGLVGSEISDTVRLLTICDIYAALTERRSYKKPMPPREALSILSGMTGKLELSLVQHFGNAMLQPGSQS